MQEPQEMQIQSLGQDDPLEKGMETHSSIHAWKIPQTEEPGGLQSIELQSRTWLKWLSMHRTFLWSWWVRAVWRLLTAMVSQRGLQYLSRLQALKHRLRSCLTPAYLLWGVWGPPRSEIELVFPALGSPREFWCSGNVGTPAELFNNCITQVWL